MEKIDGMSVSDMYGENANAVPSSIFDEIRGIVRELYVAGIVYPDITGYNFMIDKSDRIWIIDFGHVTRSKRKDKCIGGHNFIEKFIGGHNGWNPDFR